VIALPDVLPDALTDPATLSDCDDVPVETDRSEVAPEDLADAREYDNQVVVGVAGERGVLLYDDGHHGWTLPAFPVEPGEDFLATAHREFERVTCVALEIEGVAFARRREFHAGDESAVVWNVLVDATPTEPLPDDPESHADGAELAFFDGAPDGVPEPVADDIARITDQSPPNPTMTETTPTDPTESLTDPAAFADADGVDYDEIEDDSHFEQNRDHDGLAAVAVTDADGRLALVEFEYATMIPWYHVEPGEDYVDAAHIATDVLLGIDVELDALVRVRKKTSTHEETGEQVTAYEALYAASPAGDAVIPDELPNCDAERADWFDSIPEDLPDGNMREDAELFIE
jgi:ADP-ribose pyrophosphatase YjhB (NUDIX family)